MKRGLFLRFVIPLIVHVCAFSTLTSSNTFSLPLPRSFFILDTRKKKKDAKIVCLDIPRLLVSETRSVKGVGAQISGKKK